METINRLNKFTGRRDSAQGFSLIEMLTVMAVIALLAFSMPAIQSVVTAGTFRSNASAMGDLLKSAYAAAIARKTYVWIGLKQMPNGGGVGVAVVYSLSGNPTDVNNAANLGSLGRPMILPNLNLTTVSAAQVSDPNRVTQSVGQVYSASNALDVVNTTTPVSFATSLGGATQTIASNGNLPFSTVIEISPDGQATVSSTSKFAWLEMGLQPMHGNVNDLTVLQMNSFTGRVLQFSP